MKESAKGRFFENEFDQSLFGGMTDVNIWSRTFSEAEAEALTSCDNRE